MAILMHAFGYLAHAKKPLESAPYEGASKDTENETGSGRRDA